MLTEEQRKKLVETSLGARRWAYAPYSNYAVGAALLTSSEVIYEGVNIENAAYPATMCAERVAVFKAVSAGERDLLAIAVATLNGGSPCGSCRQVLSEFGLDTRVLIVDEQGRVLQETSLGELLPGAFGPMNLLKDEKEPG